MKLTMAIRRTLNVLLLLLFSSTIVACSVFRPSVDRIETLSTPVERESLDLDYAQPLDLNEPTWIVITRDNASEVFDWLSDNGYDEVVMGLTDNDYERISINYTEIRQHINNQRNILSEYKRYYEQSPQSPE